MTPWWLRPTAEGASKEENREQDKPSPASPAPSQPEPAAEPATSAPVAEETTAAPANLPSSLPLSALDTEPDLPASELSEVIAAPGATSHAAAAPALEGTEAAPSASAPAVLPFDFDDEEDEDAVEGLETAGPEVFDFDAEDPEEDREGVAEDGPDDEAKADSAEGHEGKKKRPRRSRSRRKNGRATAADTLGEDDEEALEAAAPVVEERRPERPERPERTDRRERGDRGERTEREERRPAPVSHIAHEERRFAAAPAPTAARSARSSESYVIPTDVESLGREIIISVPERSRSMADERKIAVFCDLENIALGVRDSEISKFDINLILERLLEKGKIIVKKAYADWERYSDYKRPFHEAAIELIDIPQKFYSGKNSADIKMVVDAMDLSYSKEHLDTFVLLSGDSDFSPLVSKLKENNKYVIGIGVKNSSSNLLVDNCDEFIYYEDVWRDTQKGPKLDGLNKKTAEVFSLMIESIQALVRENKDVLWGSMIKQTMQRKKPSFNEGYYGYSTFSELLEDAERKNVIKLKKDQRSGTYIVTGFAKSDGTVSGVSGRR